MNKRDELVWTAVEADFRGGTLSNRQIAKRHGVSESAIRKRSESEGWVRTLAQSAHQSAHPAHQGSELPRHGADRPVRTSGSLAKSHVEPGSDLALRLLDELDATTSHVGELEEIIEEATANDE